MPTVVNKDERSWKCEECFEIGNGNMEFEVCLSGFFFFFFFLLVWLSFFKFFLGFYLNVLITFPISKMDLDIGEDFWNASRWIHGIYR